MTCLHLQEDIKGRVSTLEKRLIIDPGLKSEFELPQARRGGTELHSNVVEGQGIPSALSCAGAWSESQRNWYEEVPGSVGVRLMLSVYRRIGIPV